MSTRILFFFCCHYAWKVEIRFMVHRPCSRRCVCICQAKHLYLRIFSVFGFPLCFLWCGQMRNTVNCDEDFVWLLCELCGLTNSQGFFSLENFNFLEFLRTCWFKLTCVLSTRGPYRNCHCIARLRFDHGDRGHTLLLSNNEQFRDLIYNATMAQTTLSNVVDLQGNSLYRKVENFSLKRYLRLLFWQLPELLFGIFWSPLCPSRDWFSTRALGFLLLPISIRKTKSSTVWHCTQLPPIWLTRS